MILNKIKKGSLINGDLGVWTVFLLLCAISLIEVYSASSRMTFVSGTRISSVCCIGRQVLYH